MKTDLFQSCGHCWVSQICWFIDCSTFTASSLSIWNSSTGIPSLPLDLFIVMLPKAHLTSHSRMFALGLWSCYHGYLDHEDFFLQFFCVFLPPLLNIFCSIRSILFLSFIVPIFAWNVPLAALILLKRSLVFPILFVFLYFFALITEDGFLISPCYVLELCIQMHIYFLFSLAKAKKIYIYR